MATVERGLRRVLFFYRRADGLRVEEVMDFPAETTDDEVDVHFQTWLEEQTQAGWVPAGSGFLVDGEGDD